MVCLSLSLSRFILSRKDRGRAAELSTTLGCLSCSSHLTCLFWFPQLQNQGDETDSLSVCNMPPAPKAPTPPHKGGQRPQAGWTLTLGGHGPTVDASPLAGHVAEGWCPAPEAVAVLVVVADLEQGQGKGVSTLDSSSLPQGLPPWHQQGGAPEPPHLLHTYPVAIALLPTAFRFKEGGVSALPLEANL